MKLTSQPTARRFLCLSFLALLLTMLSSLVANANPYASAITNDNGTIRFILNESGGNVTVKYEDGSTNASFDGITSGLNEPAGAYSFLLGAHTAYQIIVHKDGAGTPVQISTDAAANSSTAPFTWFPTPRGVETYKSPKVGWLFGRVYVANENNNVVGPTTRGFGIFTLSPDLNSIVKIGGMTTNIPGGQYVGAFAPDAFNGSTSSPWRLRMGRDDNNLYASCFGTAGGGVLQFGPDFEYTNIVLNPLGENQGIFAQTHADPEGVYVTGSQAAGNLKVYTMDPALPAPDPNTSFTDPYPPYANTNHPVLGVGGPMNVGAYGPTINGDYNMLYRYDVGAGDPSHAVLANCWTNNGGSGYKVGDLLAIVGGTYATSNHINLGAVTSIVQVAQLQVTNIDNTGPASIVFVSTPGDYTVAPVGPCSVVNLGAAAGSNAAINVWYPNVIWSGKPNFATGLGLPGFPDSQIGDVAVGPNGMLYGVFRRANLSDGGLQGFDVTQPGSPRVYDSLKRNAAGALFDTMIGNSGGDGPYGGVAFSPDGKYVATMGINDDISIALLTNGVPDDASIFIITNAPQTANGRGICWDAADNIYTVSSGQAELRVFSLGNSSTCISSNDVTGTNGSFSLNLPKVTTSLLVQNQNASQNYINSTPPGTPIAGVFRITLTTNFLDTALTVNIALAGTAIQGTHYTVNTTNAGTGIQITPTTVTFPAGTFTGVGNFFANITITPTALPLFTNTLTASLQISTSQNYLRSAPVIGTVFIQNTGPQVLLLAAGAGYTTMYRGTTNDYAEFTITRLGDTNGPANNSTSAVTPNYLTITNFVLAGTAVPPTNGAVNPDYTAGPQIWNPIGTPADGSSFSISIPPGASIVTNVVGNPRYHGDVNSPIVDASIVLSMTNRVAAAPGDFTNQLSQEGSPYAVIANNTASLTILDNRTGPEVVLYANAMTNAADSVNWTLTWNGTNNVIGGNTNTLPFVIPSYANNTVFDGVHDYDVNFGFDPSTEPLGAIAPSPVMVASNWNKVLRVTVNKQAIASPSAVNLYPHQTFGGNYALRFNMYLSTESDSINNPFVGSLNREFAEFGMNHYGTNCNWRIASPINNRNGNRGNDRTNQDGIWFTVDAGTGSQTPADFDGFQGAPIPNKGWAVGDTVSSLASIFKGVFKSPPFPAEIPFSYDPNQTGGQPVDNWVDVSMEINNQTNCTLFVNRTKIFNMLLTNVYTSGSIMLGYLDPVKNGGDPYSQYVYYSNVRAVEISPYISVQAQVPGVPLGATNYFLVAQGSSLTFTSSASFASAPITNKWFRGTGSYFNSTSGVPTLLLQSNSVNATTFNDSFTKTFSVLADATNYMNVYSDAAGSVTSRVAGVEVVFGPTNQNVGAASTSRLITTVAGPQAPNQFQWYFNTVSNFGTATKIVADSHYGTPTTGTLWLTNITTADNGFYWLAATNTSAFTAASARSVVTSAAQVTVGNAPSALSVTPSPQTDAWGSNATFTVSASGDAPFTYVWKKGATVLANNTHIGGATSSVLTISNITAGDAGTYTAAVTNAFGGATANGVLNEYTAAPRIISVGLAGANVTVSFTTTNAFDTTTTFTLQAEPDLTLNNWTNVPGSYTGSGNGDFQVTSPVNPAAPQLFYRVIHN